MARKSLLRKTLKQSILWEKNRFKRARLKKALLHDIEKTVDTLQKIQKMSRNSARSRMNRRCFITRSSRSVSRFCRLSRHALREFTKEGFLPRITKSSW